MTIRIPETNITDKVLKFFGKKRGVKLPTEAYEKFGHHVYAKAQKENFWKALLRPRHKELPEGMVDLYAMNGIKPDLKE
jgi:hypothetical protein